MKNYSSSNERKAWSICINLVNASDRKEIITELTELDRFTQELHKDCLQDIKSFCRYYVLHYGIN